MRILVLCNQWHVKKHLLSVLDSSQALRAAHQWHRCVGGQDAVEPPDIAFDLQADTIHDIAARVPGGPPDLMLVWEPGYQALPRQIEEAPFPVVALLSDWNLVLRSLVGMLDAFDYVFTDKPGVEMLARLGYDRADRWHMWGHDPARFRRLPGVSRDTDILMIGNLNQDIQRERAPWIYRLAKLADRHRVRIAGGLYGDAYVRALNSAKITFNRSIRGELNMRCYEAAACGSLLFYEEENLEIRDLFQDRVHCVLYNERNLEDLLAHYLERDDERRAIANHAEQLVRDHTLAHELLRLVDRIAALNLSGRPQDRPFFALPQVERRRRHARQMLRTMTPDNVFLSCQWLANAAVADPQSSVAAGDAAVATAYLANEFARSNPAAGSEAGDKAATLALRAVELNPQSALAHLTLGVLLMTARCFEPAQGELRAAIQCLDRGDHCDDPLELFFPHDLVEFRIQYEQVYRATLGDPEAFGRERARLLRYQAGLALGELAETAGDPRLARDAYTLAAEARPDLGKAKAGAARALAALGKQGRAADLLRAALETDPFLVDEWPRCARLLAAAGRADEARAFLAERLTVARGVTALESAGADLRQCLAELDATGAPRGTSSTPPQATATTAV